METSDKPHGDNVVVHKCCKSNQRYDSKNRSCVDLEMEGFNDKNTNGMLMTGDTLINLPWWTPEVEADGNSFSRPIAAVLFQLKISMPDCTESEMIKKIAHKDDMSQFHIPQDGSSLSESSLILTTSGYLVWRPAAGLMNALPNTDFCLDQVSDMTFIAMMCKEACTSQKPCIRKCCSPGTAFDKNHLECLPSKRPWTPNLYDGDLNESQINPKSILHPRYQYGSPHCTGGRTEYILLDPRVDSGLKKFKTFVNGSIVVNEVVAGSYALDPSQYCTDVLRSHDTTIKGSNESVVPVNGDLDQIVLVCYYTDDNVHGTGARITATLLTLTAIVYLIT